MTVSTNGHHPTPDDPGEHEVDGIPVDLGAPISGHVAIGVDHGWPDEPPGLRLVDPATTPAKVDPTAAALARLDASTLAERRAYRVAQGWMRRAYRAEVESVADRRTRLEHWLRRLGWTSPAWPPRRAELVVSHTRIENRALALAGRDRGWWARRVPVGVAATERRRFTYSTPDRHHPHIGHVAHRTVIILTARYQPTRITITLAAALLTVVVMNLAAWLTWH